MQEGQVSSQDLVKALNQVKMNGNQGGGSSIRFYIFIAFLIAMLAYSVALLNREHVCNLLKTNHNEFYINH
ncbi:unnamed protein product [Caenorhabditis brenneri]